MADTTKVPYRPGDIDIKTCMLFNYNKKALDIRHLMLEFNIFHDLYTNGTKCEMLIADGNGIVEMMPIIGEEKLILQFKTPTEPKVITYNFQIYKISDKQKVDQRSETIILHGVSQETVNNARRSVSKSYTDMTASEIVRGIYESYLRPTEEDFNIALKKSKITIQNIPNNLHIVFPEIRPYDAIRYVAQEAYDSGNFSTKTYENNELIEENTSEFLNSTISSNFCFFQKTDGWYFQTIDSLLYKTPVDNFYLVDASYEENINDGVTSEDGKTRPAISPHQKINSLNFVNQFDTLKSSGAGLYSSYTETIDPILKRFTRNSFVYANEIKNMAYLEQDRNTFDSEFIFSKDSFFKKNDGVSNRRYLVSNIGENYSKQSMFGNANKTDPQIRNPRRLHNKIYHDIASRMKLNNIVFNVSIPGNTTIEIGDVVNLHIPQSSQMTEYMNRLNLLYDKKFLVTSIRQTYNKQDNNFFTMMQCVKDTYAKRLVEEAQTTELEYEE